MLVNPNRTVAALTPLVFAPAAGAISALAAKHGLDIDGAELSAIFVTGATIAFAKAGLWMKGWQAYEKRELDARDAPVGALAFVDGAETAAVDSDDDDEADVEFDIDTDDDPIDVPVDDFEAQFATPKG